MENIVNELSIKFSQEFELALITACMRKGFVISVASAPDFQTVEFEEWKTLIHMPTNTKICKYTSTPKITMGEFNSNDMTVRCDLEFIQL